MQESASERRAKQIMRINRRLKTLPSDDEDEVVVKRHKEVGFTCKELQSHVEKPLREWLSTVDIQRYCRSVYLAVLRNLVEPLCVFSFHVQWKMLPASDSLLVRCE